MVDRVIPVVGVEPAAHSACLAMNRMRKRSSGLGRNGQRGDWAQI